MKNAGKNLEKEKIDSPFLLNEWLDAIEELKKTNPKTYEEIEEYADKEWASYIADELEVADEPLELINNYLNLISDKGIISRKDFVSEKKGQKIIITITGKYMPIIRRGGFFTYLIQVANGRIFDFDEKIAGDTCRIELSPGVFTLKVALSYRTGRGSINVSDKDLSKLGMDMIENVTLVPAGKETGIAEMMFSGSKVMQGYVIMNVTDANLIGLKEGSRVELIKKEAEGGAEKEAVKEAEEETAKAPEEEKAVEQPEEEKVEKDETQSQEPKMAKNYIPKETPKPKVQKQEIKDVKKPKIPKKQTPQDKTKQMKDFEAKIDKLRGQ
jgi:hypothetical protein